MANKKLILNDKFCFLDFEVDPLANLLIKQTREKRLESKVMSLLILLASNNGEVVTRTEILKRLWPNVVVGDEVISQLIYALRNVLGDDAKNPQYIETIPKKGYRFIAEVKMVEPETIAIPTPKQKTDISKKHNKPTEKHILISILTMSLLVIIGFYDRVFLKKPKSTFIIESVLPVTQKMGVEGDFAFHQNHNKMIYVSSTEQRVDLYLKTLTTNKFQQLTDDLWVEYSPLWLDENTLVYMRQQAGEYQIIRHKLQQDAEIIYESKNTIINLAINAVNPNELTFIEYDHYRHNRLNELKSLNITNGKTQYLHDSLLNLPSEIHHPLYTSDGKTLYFFDNSDEVKQIVSLNLQSNIYTTITQQFSTVNHIALIDDENLLISGQLSATKGIWQVNINDLSVTNILPSTGGQKIVQAMLKQGQLYYATHKASVNQMIADINTQTIDPLPKLNSEANEYSGIYSQGNNTIYFVSNRTGFYEIWAYNVNSQQTKQVSKIQAAFIYKPILSHSEDYLAVVYQKEALTLAVISIATGKPINETSIPSMKHPLAWSINDESLYISEHKGQVNIYQYDRNTLQPTLIQKKAGLFARQSADSKTLTLVDYKFEGLIKKNLITEEVIPLNNAITNLTELMPGQLTVVGESILTIKTGGKTSQLQQYPLMSNGQKNTGDNNGKFLMALPNSSWVTDFSSDGNKAIISVQAAPQGDIMKIILSQ